MIRFSKINKWFGDLHVLKDINLNVEAGEVVVVCGPSGSGKSTLIRCINRLEPIQQGELVVDNMKVHDKKTNMTRIRAEIGFVFQQFNLYPHMTALGNVTIAPVKVRKMKKNEAEKLGREILERVGLGAKADSYPA
ncbi:MAG: amino acid ABC transporter ATP-binding protein, partial [Syntrophobacteraceae bacterium]|nr:amino acid ABC transporter ATP-binding protein [Syntrophobacteraceae bacterium]